MFCKRRIAENNVGCPNEKLLWHGTSNALITVICSEGCDFRVSNPSGALGSGVYFAECEICIPNPLNLLGSVWLHRML